MDPQKPPVSVLRGTAKVRQPWWRRWDGVCGLAGSCPEPSTTHGSSQLPSPGTGGPSGPISQPRPQGPVPRARSGPRTRSAGFGRACTPVSAPPISCARAGAFRALSAHQTIWGGPVPSSLQSLLSPSLMLASLRRSPWTPENALGLECRGFSSPGHRPSQPRRAPYLPGTARGETQPGTSGFPGALPEPGLQRPPPQVPGNLEGRRATGALEEPREHVTARGPPETPSRAPAQCKALPPFPQLLPGYLGVP